MQIYLAGPLFTTAERDFNIYLGEKLQQVDPSIEVWLPQAEVNTSDLFSIADQCIAGLISSDLVVAVLDGPDSDSGTCVEIGLAWALRKRILGLHTDIRRSGELQGLNAMIPPLCLKICTNVSSLMKEVKGVFDE